MSLIGMGMGFSDQASAMPKGEFVGKMNALLSAAPQDADALITLGREGLAKWAGNDAEYQDIAYTSMAFNYCWKGQKDQAIKEVDQALKLSPPMTAFFLKAYILMGQNNIEETFKICMDGALYFKSSDMENVYKFEIIAKP